MKYKVGQRVVFHVWGTNNQGYVGVRNGFVLAAPKGKAGYYSVMDGDRVRMCTEDEIVGTLPGDFNDVDSICEWLEGDPA